MTMILDIMMPEKTAGKWKQSIHHQIERLNCVTHPCKMEEGGGELELKTWNASETIMDAVTF